MSKKRAFSLDFTLSVSVKTGIKAELRVPSPNIRRKRLGKVKARMKASPISDAPKQLKKSTSLPNPRMRDNKVRELTRDNRPINFPIDPRLK